MELAKGRGRWGRAVAEAVEAHGHIVPWPSLSLQGALQLRQDFGVVRQLLEEEQWGLSPELRQTLLTLSIFQRLDGALLCLFQQPLPKSEVQRRPPCCCESLFPNSRLFALPLATLCALPPILLSYLVWLSIVVKPLLLPTACFPLLPSQVHAMKSSPSNCPAAALTA